MELAKRIREHRERLGMSQADLAKAVFVTRNTISNWETNRTYPDVQSLLILSNLFGVSIDSLVKEDSRKMQDALAAGAKKMARLGVVMMAFGLARLVWVIMGIVSICPAEHHRLSRFSTGSIANRHRPRHGSAPRPAPAQEL
ncbi:helix-turn-helix transcriptional regulator [Collinsella sp. An307]|uniref:helix-turn-helix transcriptional regulator n=1 Tax=Collinsella sp. An307 TaxID=1965630 RepID=UPI000B3865BA|nr:helix-turn-helix transcriptional regulator [Collinsella sp. An307]OUO22424.1 hypothetical protein B5F89_00880 [Collinsella sp. An307]